MNGLVGGIPRDGYHVNVVAHHSADDFSVHACDGGKSADGSRFTNEPAFTASVGAGEQQRKWELC